MDRRALLRVLAAGGAGVLAAPLLAACAEQEAPEEAAMDRTGYLAADLARSPGSADAGRPAAEAVARFAADLYARLATTPGNLVCSPWSVAVALTMARLGARGRTAHEMDQVLHATGLTRFTAGIGWLDRQLQSRAERRTTPDGQRLDVALETANSLWGQRGVDWEAAFLDALARDLGAGMHVVDYRAAAEQARTAINAWAAHQTHDRITGIIPEGLLGTLTRLVLVNAIWLKAPWAEPFPQHRTARKPFRRGDGSELTVDMMAAGVGGGYAEGRSWRAARLPYAGGQLAMAVVVPAVGTDLAAVERELDEDGLPGLLGSFDAVPEIDLELPRWTVRTNAPLGGVLAQMGMPTAFTDEADFSGMTREEPLQVAAVLHQAFIAVDEAGTEAAAVTAVVARTSSAPAAPPPEVHADRAFLFVLHDVPTGTPLFLGRVDDPTG